MRVRIASHVYNNESLDSPSELPSPSSASMAKGTGYDANVFDNLAFRNGLRGASGEAGGAMCVDVGSDVARVEQNKAVTEEEQQVLDRVGENLARLGRVKRVGLGVEEKIEFCKVWGSRRR